jgi:hypothetical protein
MTPNPRQRKLRIIGAIALLAIVCCVVPIILLRRAVCIDDPPAEFINVAGGDFEIIQSDCDSLAKEEFVNVYVRPARANRNFLQSLFDKKNRVFSYDPGTAENPLPTITSPAPGHVLISVRALSSVILQETHWHGLEIQYDLRNVGGPDRLTIFPSPSQPPIRVK